MIDAHVQQQDAEIALLRLHLAAHRASRFWRATWPMRHLLDQRPKVVRRTRQALKALWWTATLQLPMRLRARTAYRAAIALPVHADHGPVVQSVPPVLPTTTTPMVSVIIPAYGQAGVTLICLEAIAASRTMTPFEVIVAEDASGDPDMMVLDAIVGLRLVRNQSNLGFLHNCNTTALLARGRYLLFLNNDTEPLPGFIDELVALAEARPDVGLVGSKLLFPDGRLQEAGGIIWQDGTGWNYGRGDDPTLPRYNTVREVDYISGASILLKRDLFEALGGFDPLFAPAYYEDVDLAFRIRARGLRVMYQPASVVIHHEGVSHGTDPTSGIKAQQEVNRHRLLARWPQLLASEHSPSGTDPMRAPEHAKGRTTILVIDHYVPEPDRDAGSRSTMGIVTALRDAGWVVKFWPQNRTHNDYTQLLEAIGIEVLDGRLDLNFPQWIARNGAELDHVLAIRPEVADEYISDLLSHTKARLSFYGVDIHHVRMRRQAILLGDAALAAEANEMEKLERRLWGMFDVLLYPSEAEAAQVRSLVPGAPARGIVPFSFDRFRARGAPPVEPVILFVAGFAHPPNIDAATWLVREILPLVRARVPATRLVLAGSHPTAEVRALSDGDRITVTGNLSEAGLAAIYLEARASIVPLRVGAGVKGKVVEALQQGLPLVTTSIGAEGIPGLEQVATVTDDAAGLAAGLVMLLLDDRRWAVNSAVQVAFAERHFSRAALAESLFAALA
ncbi:glycosyltransferase [Lichenicola cladoniae]|uniref:Glycosyltransferase n=1 Tax=Lichenicola cladoniae TaxID=1484109 RepID=A0A6M8HUI6_9PROT|nr:glycosyltransferase [Lichenicola cladoniae]QKE92224.1 glycosyltransferase [Lichenicola cladoniae]